MHCDLLARLVTQCDPLWNSKPKEKIRQSHAANPKENYTNMIRSLRAMMGISFVEPRFSHDAENGQILQNLGKESDFNFSEICKNLKTKYLPFLRPLLQKSLILNFKSVTCRHFTTEEPQFEN